MKKRGTTICCAVCTTLCLVFLGLAIVILVLNEVGFFKDEVDKYVREQLTLEEGHQTYDQWVDPTIPMYKDFYVFNLTNPQEFKDGAPPKFKELGPYRYRERRVKTILHHNHNNGTIEYTMSRTFHFEQYKNFSDDDMVTTVNFVYVTAINIAAGNILEEAALSFLAFITRPRPDAWIKVKARDLFWNYTDNFLEALYNTGQVPKKYINLQYNNSDLDLNHPSVVYSGEINSQRTGQLIQWAGKKNLGIWKDDSANNITGNEGIVWQPFIDQGDEIKAFISDTQRSFRLRSNEKSSVLGIDAYRFRVEASEFLPNPSYWTYDGITPNGLLYLGVLQDPNAPVFGSKPHFLDCDPSLRAKMEGIREADRNVDDIFVDIEPITGSTLYVHQQLQINVNVTKSSMLFPFHKINPPLYFPMIYIDEWAMIDDGLKSKLEEMVFTPLTAINVSIWVAFGLFCFISLLTGLIAVNRCIRLYQLTHRNELNIPLLEHAETT